MNPKRFFLFVLFVGLLTFLAFRLLVDGQQPQEVASTQAEAPDAPFCDIEEANVQTYFLRQSARAHSLVIHRESSESPFLILEPKPDVIGPSSLRALHACFLRSTSAPAPPEWGNMSDADLGLDPAVLDCVVTDFQGNTWNLKVGAPDRGAAWRAADLNGKRIRFSTDYFGRLMHPPHQWRDYAILPGANRFTQIAWRPLQGEGWVLFHHMSGWRLQEPIDAPLSKHAVGALNRMLGARARGFGHSLLYDEQYADRENLAQLEFSNGKETAQIYFGPHGTIQEGRPYLLEPEAEDFSLLSKSIEEMRSKLLIEIDRNTIQGLSLEFDGASSRWSLTRKGWVYGEGRVLSEKEKAFLDSLLLAFLGLERDGGHPVPPEAPSGKCSIFAARSQEANIRWWATETGAVLFVVGSGEVAYATPLNLPHATRVFAEGFLEEN